ncbi:MAG: isochorismate synthase [Flavobacteriaceae bacterium]|nr:isochorismate synthase [Flavobacteriaceae bacterium]
MKLEKLFQKLENTYRAQRPFAVYRKPNDTNVIGYFQNNVVPHYLGDYSDKGFIFAPFNRNEKALFIPQNASENWVVQGTEALQSNSTNIVLQVSDLNNQKKQHLKLVEKGIGFIKQGTAQKIVLSRKESLTFKEFSISSAFKKLVHQYANALIYVWFHPKSGLWIGATPERLLSVSKNKFSTMALAGTQVYQGIAAVKWQNKEKEEQQYVTDFIKSSIGDLVTQLRISKPYTMKAGNLLHLRTDLAGILTKNEDLGLLIEKLHPTPAVCGVPTNIARDFIVNNEEYDREFYTGFLGELSLNEQTDLFVNLRCMKIDENRANIFVGGGITSESDAEREWQETVEKSKVIKKALAFR